MYKKFTEGLIFGAGFGISFIALWYAAVYLLNPLLMSSSEEHIVNNKLSSIESETKKSISEKLEQLNSNYQSFRELGPDEQIKEASVIFKAVYVLSSNGKMKAIIKEIYKQNPNIIFHYKVGNEYPHSSYYPKEDTNYGEGIIVLLSGNPARMNRSLSVYYNRIPGLGDMPVKFFKNKCKKEA
ncbi:MAG: hypothetical protein OQL19_09715 [Gammaproteobacteria bacterium]|nr:hypothetical protein [Gammaproteobacteria bacterium]